MQLPSQFEFHQQIRALQGTSDHALALNMFEHLQQTAQDTFDEIDRMIADQQQ